MKIKIEKMTSKDGDTNGRKWTKLGVASGGKWYNCFAGPWNSSWSEGDFIDIEVEEKEWNGKTYYNIQKPDIYKQLKDLEARVLALESGSPKPPQAEDVQESYEEECPF